MPVINYTDNTKNYMVLIIDLLKDFRLDIDGIEEYKIPLYVATASRLKKALNSKTKKISNRLPIMAIDFVDFTRAEERITNRLNKRVAVQLPDNETIRVNRNGAAYDFNYKMTLWTKTTEDLTNIAEAIIASFHNNVRYQDYKTIFGDIVSTPIRLVGDPANESDLNELEFNNDKVSQMSFDFTVEGTIETNTPVDKRKIDQINLLIEQEKNNVVQILDQYTVE